MTDRDVEREIAANEERAEDADRRDDGPIADTLEQAIDPLTRSIDNDQGTDEDDRDPDRERRLNDADQRPD